MRTDTETIDLTGDDDEEFLPQSSSPYRQSMGHISLPAMNIPAHSPNPLPSTSSAFFPGSFVQQASVDNSSNGYSNGNGNPIIDLTRTPSPQQSRHSHPQPHHQPQFHYQRPIIHHRQMSIPVGPSTSGGGGGGSMTMPHPPFQHYPPPPQTQPSTPMNNPQRPACIGQLSCTALVLYPIPYLNSPTYSDDLEMNANANASGSESNAFDPDNLFQNNPMPGPPHPNGQIGSIDDWVVVRLKVEPPKATQEGNPTPCSVAIIKPSVRTPSGEVIPPEQFGVVEQRVANVLGVMLGKSLIKVEAKVMRGRPKLPVLPLQILVFTPQGNVNVIGSHLQNLGLLLNHPSAPFDINGLTANGLLYVNPHNPPAGGWTAHARGGMGAFGSLSAVNGPNGMNGGPPNNAGFMNARWHTNSPSQLSIQPGQHPQKSVEVQRNQAAEAVFASLRSGEELAESTPPAALLGTKLYPHQKKALTFLLEREGELQGGSKFWKVRGGLGDVGESLGLKCEKGRRWVNVVTCKEVSEPPKECKGSLLADDMGLGKTITCVALIASTLDSAKKFVDEPLVPPTPPPPTIPNIEALDLQPSHFAGSVWGMPPTSNPSPLTSIAPTSSNSSTLSTKAQAKMRAQEKAAESVYTRMKRLKVKSRGTLIICPLSTVSNWEDQFREHWSGGGVSVVGGNGAADDCGKEKVKKEKGVKKEKENVSLKEKGTEFVFEEWKKEDGEPSLPMGVSVTNTGSGSFTSSPPSTQGQDQDRKPNLNGTEEAKETPLRIYVYHGNARRPDPAFLADFDAVITTYATLASEFSKQVRSMESSGAGDGDTDTDLEKGKKLCGMKRKKCCNGAGEENASPLQMVHWFRVVLDEAHSIKETSTVASRASCDLIADRRLCLTGTPVQNKLDDVYALIKFLRAEPLDDKAVWTEYIGTPVKFGQSLGITRLQTVMKCLTLRRTKESKSEDGQKILNLPPRRDELRYLRFDESEQKIYDQVFQESKDEFKELTKQNEVMKNYVGILQKILRLRQICDHWQLVAGSDGQLFGTCLENAIKAIEREGLTMDLANAVYALLREGGSAQCVACGYDLGAHYDQQAAGGDLGDPAFSNTPAQKKTKKSKACTGTPASGSGTRQNSPGVSGPRALMTKCQHLYCLSCFDKAHASQAPPQPLFLDGFIAEVESSTKLCSVCQTALVPCQDVIEVDLVNACIKPSINPSNPSGTRPKRVRGEVNHLTFNPSTKIRALLNDLLESSKLNPYSANFDPEVMMVDSNGNTSDDNIIKTIVFSQWTSMLDKIEEGLDMFNIRYERLDGTMKREERTKAMDELKNSKSCEVLLVSLRAGGVGLNLTAAQRVYLMDPYWNPAVENQAVDRIHRLGQTKPVTTIKFIIENTIEARLLEVQKKKTALANMTLAGTTYSKSELMARRMDELKELFGV